MNLWLLSPFSPLPEPGAHESRTAALARHLTDAGHDVVWFASDWDHRRKQPVGEVVPDFTTADTEPGTGSATIHLIPTPPYHKNISLRRFLSHRTWGNRLVHEAKRLVAEGDLAPPDLILSSSPPLDAPRAAFQLRTHFDCPVKIDLTDLWPHTFERIFQSLPRGICGSEGGGRRTALRLRPLYRMAHSHWQKADGVSAMSQEYLDEVRRVAPDQDTHLCYIGGSVGEVVPDFASKLGTSSPTIHFLYLGALTDSYDFPTLFAAAELLANEGHDFHLHIAGSGPLEEALQQETRNLKLTRRVTFHGFLDEDAMDDLCAQCQVGLNIIRPGLHITMPHKLNDYLCAGLPVINSLRGEAEELLNRYSAGLTYQAGDPDSLAAAMRSCLDAKNAPRNGALTLAAERLDREKTYPEWVVWLCS